MQTSLFKPKTPTINSRGFLEVEAADVEAQFLFKAKCRREGLPAVLAVRNPRTVELVAYVNDGRLTDGAKAHLAAMLTVAVMPGGVVICTSRQLVCSPLSYDAGYFFAEQIATELSNPVNIIKGDLTHKKHIKIEVKKRMDSSLKIVAGKSQLDAYWQTSFQAA